MELRTFSPEDAAGMLDILTDNRVNKTYMLPDFARKEDALPLFHRLMDRSGSEDHFVRGIFLEDRPIGFLNDVEIVDASIELGYVIHPDYWNRGYATAALKKAIEDLFARGYQEVRCGAFTENPASIRVMEKAGMTLLPLTEEIPYRGSVHHCVYYGIRWQTSAQ